MTSADSPRATLDKRLDFPLLVAAALAMSLVVARACLQSATLDEADAYLEFSAQSEPRHFYPTSGNHVLNSMIVRLFTTVFGLSQLSFRAGAMIGAAIFITSAYF